MASSSNPRFICTVCGAAYMRKEHLNRHQAEHSTRAFVCAECGLSFSRSDSLRRHTKTHNNKGTPIPRVEKACDLCHSLKIKCDRQNPCAVCAKRGVYCTFDRPGSTTSSTTDAASLRGASQESQENKNKTYQQQQQEQQEQHPRKYRRVESSTNTNTNNLGQGQEGQEEEQIFSLNDGIVGKAETDFSSLEEDKQPLRSLISAERPSMQNIRFTLRKQEVQIQRDFMTVSDPGQQQQPPPPQPQPSDQILRLSELFEVSKAFVGNQNLDHETRDLAKYHDNHHEQGEDMNALMREIDVRHYINLYFEYFHSQWPFLLKNSFRPETEPPIMGLAVVMTGLWITEESRLRRLAWRIHAHLHLIFKTQMENWSVKCNGNGNGNTKIYPSSPWPLATYQAILLFTIFSLTAYNSTYVFEDDASNNGNDSDILDRIYPIFTHLVCTCRAQGVLYYPAMLSKIHDDDPLTYKFQALEEFKFFALTLFKVDNLISRILLQEDNNSNQHTRLSIAELQFPLLVSNYLWESPGIREFLRRRARQCRDPSASSEVYGAIMASDHKTILNRELNPWICDILGSTMSSSTMESEQQKRLRRKAWMSLGPWLGYVMGIN